MSLPRWSVRRPALVVAGTLVIILWGLMEYGTISRREDPEFKIATSLVVTIYPGASAGKVEQQVTRKLEEAIEELESLDKLRSISRENLSIVIVTVRYDSDVGLEWQKLRSVVSEARDDLPSSIIGPDVWDKFGDTTAMILVVSGPDQLQNRDVAKDLRAELRRLPCVGKMTLYGEPEEAIYVETDRGTMEKFGFTPVRLKKLMEARNLRIPAGMIHTPLTTLRVEPTGQFTAVDEIGSIILDVSEETGQPVHLSDVFTVRRATKDPPDTKVLSRGRPVVALGITMKRGYNVVELGRKVRAALDRFEAERLPPGVDVQVLHDSPRQVSRQVDSLMLNLLEGLVIVILSMAMLMGLTSATISAVSIPLSILAAFAVMPAMGTTLQNVSISAFIIALGMLVDNSIIVVDNIDVKLAQGLGRLEAAARGTEEITLATISGTVATVIAFLPMLLLTKETGAYVRSLPLVVAASLLGSLLVSLSLTPLMARWILRPSSTDQGASQGVVLGAMSRWYRGFMGWCLRHRWAVVLLALAMPVLAGVMLREVGFSFFPEASRDQFTVDIDLKEGSSILETERIAREAEARLIQDPDVRSTLVYVGRGGPRFYITVVPQFQRSNYAQIMVNTRSPEATFQVIERFNEFAATRFPGARVHAKKMILGIPIAAPVAFRVVGEDLDELRRISRQVQAILEDTPGADLVRDDMGEDVPSLEVQVDEERAKRVGVTNADVALAFLSTYQGFELTRFLDGEYEIPVYLRLTDRERTLDRDLGLLPVASMVTGEKVPLASIATVRPKWGPGVIRRRNGRRTVTVLAWNSGVLADDVVRAAWPRIQAMDLPAGYRVEVAGEKEERDRAFGELLEVFAMIVAGITGLLLLQFGSFRKALVVLLVVPLSITGAALGLFLGGYSFSFMAFLGVVSLAGMVIKNSVVWMEFVAQAEQRGQALGQAVIEAGVQRLRPILLTTITTVGGLIPLGMFGGVLFEPMAWAMVAGLTLATILTLVIIPVVYTLLAPKRGVGGKVAAMVLLTAVSLPGLAHGDPGSLDPRAVAAPSDDAAPGESPSGLVPGQACAPPQGPHPLVRYMATARERNPMVLRAKAELAKARASRSRVTASFLPTPELEATYTRLDQAPELDVHLGPMQLPPIEVPVLGEMELPPMDLDLPPMPLSDDDIYRLGLKVTLPLVAGGRRLALMTAADRGIEARRLALDAVTRGVEMKVLASYVLALQAKDLVALWEEREQVERRAVALEEAKVSEGAGVPLDLDVALTKAADTHRRLVMARNEFRARLARLGHDAGLDSSAGLELRPIHDCWVPDPGLPEADRLAAAAGSVPAVVARRIETEALEAKAESVHRELYPVVAFQGEAGWRKGEPGFIDGRTYWQATCVLRWNLLADPGVWAREREARQEQAIAQVEHQAALDAKTMALTDASRVLRDTREMVSVTRQALAVARRGLANALKARERGAVPLSVVMEARKALYEARDHALRAAYGRLLARARLRYELGLPVLATAAPAPAGSPARPNAGRRRPRD